VIAALAPRHRCIAPDLLGFGLSDRPRDFSYTPEAHAHIIKRVVDALALDRFALVVHDFGGPIALPLALENPSRVSRLVVLNSWMWSFRDDRQMQRRAGMAGGRLGRFLYRHANLSLRGLLPYAYGDRRKLTPEIHRTYLDRFPDAWSRGAVLWPLARAINGSSDYYDSLWARRHRLSAIPALILWGMKDRACPPYLLDRWRLALPHARVTELPRAGHWPHEEEPGVVSAAIADFLGADTTN
jgi:haloalkane dehalogenase